MKLIELFQKLDVVRLALHKNLISLDDELESTFNIFLEEIKELELLINEVKNEHKRD